MFHAATFSPVGPQHHRVNVTGNNKQQHDMLVRRERTSGLISGLMAKNKKGKNILHIVGRRKKGSLANNIPGHNFKYAPRWFFVSKTISKKRERDRNFLFASSSCSSYLSAVRS